jgi:hypothetical protein
MIKIIRHPLNVLGLVATLLLVPLFAMQFTDQVNWSLADFLVMGTLLLSAGLLASWVWRKFPKSNRRIWYLLLIGLVFFIIWAELAVGILGTPFAGS